MSDANAGPSSPNARRRLGEQAPEVVDAMRPSKAGSPRASLQSQRSGQRSLHATDEDKETAQAAEAEARVRRDRLMDDALRSLPTEAEREAGRAGRGAHHASQTGPHRQHDERGSQSDERALGNDRRLSAGSDVAGSVMSSGGPRRGSVQHTTLRRPSVGAIADARRGSNVLEGLRTWIAGGIQADREAGEKHADGTHHHDSHTAHGSSRRKNSAKHKASSRKRRHHKTSEASSPSASDIVVTLQQRSDGGDRTGDLTEQELPPPPNQSTAEALHQAANRSKARAPRLHFAPQKRNIRRKDLPSDYEAGDTYRCLDDFVNESRLNRRRARQSSKRRGSRASRASSRSSKSSRASMSSGASSSSSSDASDSGGSGSSSSSSASGRLTMARLRAFFGDSDSSSSSSSSSSSTGDTHSSDSRSRRSSDSRSSTSSRSFHLFRRRRASRAGSSRSSSENGDRPIPLTPRMAPQRFQLKGGAARRRRQRALKRLRAQEKQLVKEGKISMRASKAARRKAKQAKEQAGGVTQYYLFTPVALSTSARPHQHFHRGVSRQRFDPQQPVARSSSPFISQPIATDGSPGRPSKILQTTSFDHVRARLHALRRYKRQRDHVEGDLGDAEISEDEDEDEDVDEKEESKNLAGHDAQEKTARQDSEAKASLKQRAEELDFDEEGDLALPPPAIDLPDEHLSALSSGSRKRQRQRQEKWHMSDVPLTPKVIMARASEFSRDLEAASPNAPFAATLATHEEASEAVEETQRSPPESSRSGNRSSEAATKSQHSAGSNRTKIASPNPGGYPLPSHTGDGRDAAWWLDVNCPTYRDMTELSKMFPLHPLTVEDVLQQDTREKVEIFEKLGYYFVVVRAIDERYFKYTSAAPAGSRSPVGSPKQTQHSTRTTKTEEAKDGSIEMEELGSTLSEKGERKGSTVTDISSKAFGSSSGGASTAKISDELEKAGTSSPKPRVEIVEGIGGKEGVEGVGVGAVNLYLVVFKHGIISFHFEDISKHTNKVRNRVIDLSQPVDLTSDWITHTIFDSVIDAFFPLLSFVESEVDVIDRLTSEPLPSTKSEMRKARTAHITGMEGDNTKGRDEMLPTVYVRQEDLTTVFRPLPRFVVGKTAQKILPSFLLAKRLVRSRLALDDDHLERPRSLIQRIFGLNSKPARVSAFLSESAVGQSSMLRRINETRKITTGLSRLLGPKNDSVRGLRKRLVDLRGTSASQEEMSIYMGDVQDHIVTLLSQLGSCENRLGDIHMSYLSSIRMMNNRVSHSTDEILIVLARITITIVHVVFITSLFSFNVNVPQNVKPGPNYTDFGLVLALTCLVGILVNVLAQYWIRRAKYKMEKRRAGR